MVSLSKTRLSQTTHLASDEWLENLYAIDPSIDITSLKGIVDFLRPYYDSKSMVSGESVWAHVLGAVNLLVPLRLGHESIAACLLWPLEGQEAAAHKKARAKFGAPILSLAEGVARMGAMGALSTQSTVGMDAEAQSAQLESLRKMLLAMVQDVRVVLIKLADHTQDLRFVVKSGEKHIQNELAHLARDIFAPLANRLGVWQLKWEIEDLSFHLLEPKTYKEIAQLLDDKRVNREQFIEKVLNELRQELLRHEIRADIMGRPKHIYSIYNKMTRKHMNFDALYDVRAVRVLVDDVKDCYAVLGLVHQLWSPIPKEFDDYIAKPKSNHYRSLHTAVIGPEGKSVEVQIRTHEMHHHSELGVAAHWRYKEGVRQNKGYDEKITWLRQVLEWKDEVKNTGDLAEQFKTGLFDETIYVLTPQGKVVDLPLGSTPIDFAYQVHTELGHRCRGAKVDGAIVPLNTVLHNGQHVEITAATQGGPSRDWLNPTLGFLKSTGARSKVRQWFNRLNLEADVAQGRLILEKALNRKTQSAFNWEQLAESEGYEKLSDFLADLGRGEIGIKRLQQALHPKPVVIEAPSIPLKRKSRNDQTGVLVVGVDKLLTIPAKCCKPVPPELIVGFISRGHGVTVHRAHCANLKRLDPQRLVSAQWGSASDASFSLELELEALDRRGLLRDISEIFSRERVNVTATHTLTKDMVARMRFTVEVSHLDQLSRVLLLIEEVKGVLWARRRLGA